MVPILVPPSNTRGLKNNLSLCFFKPMDQLKELLLGSCGGLAEIFEPL